MTELHLSLSIHEYRYEYEITAYGKSLILVIFSFIIFHWLLSLSIEIFQSVI